MVKKTDLFELRRISDKNRIWAIGVLVAALTFWLAGSALAANVNFNFDDGVPALVPGQGTSFDQTSAGLSAHFSSPSDNHGPAFSIQSDSTTGFRMSLFSGNYLYDNNLNRNLLDIKFSQPINSISLAFATADFQQVEVPTTIQVTAFQNSTGTSPVGSATAHGTYGSDTMPMGTLSFSTSGQSFDLVEIGIPFQPRGASDFFLDNIVVAISGTGAGTGSGAATGGPDTSTGGTIPAGSGDPNNSNAAAVPEPGSLALFVAGLFSIAFLNRPKNDE